jgi:hypothetical protein
MKNASFAKYIKSIDDLNIYIGELQTINRALALAADYKNILTITRFPIRIFSDNQNALKAISNSYRHSG